MNQFIYFSYDSENEGKDLTPFLFWYLERWFLYKHTSILNFSSYKENVFPLHFPQAEKQRENCDE